MKKILVLLMALMPMMMVSAKVDKQVVVFAVDLHCQGCCDKVMKNISYEKGVKDIQCDLQKKTVTVTYDATKTDVPTLQKAFAKIGKPATTVKPGQHQCSGQCGGQCGHHHGEGEHKCDGHHHEGEHKCDAHSGATPVKK